MTNAELQTDMQIRTYWEIIERTLERHERFNHLYIDKWPRLVEMQETVMIGSFSWLGMSSKTRWLYRPSAVTVGSHLATPGDIVRDYIAFKYPKKLRCTSKQYALVMEKRHHPLYANPGHYPDSFYVDLKSAYWTILKAVGYDVDYCPGKWLASGLPMDDFPYAGSKIVRNCLVSNGLLSRKRIWKMPEAKLIVTDLGSSRPNMVLWACVQDILAGIARDVVKAGCVYVHTDGYIVQARNMVAVTSVIEDWGFDWQIKQSGDATIYSSGCYDIGEHVHKSKAAIPQAINAIREVSRIDWLRKSMSKHMGRVDRA